MARAPYVEDGIAAGRLVAPFSLSVPCSSVRAETRIAMSKQVLGGPTHQ